MACCIITAYVMNRLIKACEVMDLNFIKIQYNAFDDGIGSKPVSTKQTTTMAKFSVEGMTCAACVDTVQHAIRSLAGVKAARVSLALCQASVIYDPDLVSEAEIANEIIEAGYSVKIGQRTAQESLEMTEQKEKVKALQQSFVEALTSATIISTISTMNTFLNDLRILTSIAILGISLGVQVKAARHIHQAAWTGRQKLDMDFLTSISLLLGTLLGLGSWYTFDLKRADSYLSSATYLAAVILGGRYLRAILQRQTTKSLAHLYRLQCQTAQVEISRLKHSNESAIEKVPALALESGDQIWLQPGRIIPCDCYVVSGRSVVDQSTMTGESLPVVRQVGDFLMSGTENLSAPLLAVVSQPQERSALDKLVSSIASATEIRPEEESSSLPVRHFVKLILILAVVSATLEFTSQPATQSLQQSLSLACERAMAILASACPCALGLASPSAYLSALTVAWDKGVILMGGLPVLRKLSELTHVVADKTGTLTTGQLSVTHVEGRLQDWHYLGICAAERQDAQTHPVGRAIFQWSLLQLDETEKLQQSKVEVSQMESVAGAGVRCTVIITGEEKQHQISIGTETFLKDGGVLIASQDFQSLTQQSVVHVAVDNQHVATLYVQDTVRPEASRVLRRMKQDFDWEITMLTGDNAIEAGRISSMLDIPVLSAQALPHQKRDLVQQKLSSKTRVAMLGDGLNDIGAMTAADVGILLSPGLSKSNAASMQAADVILTSPHLGGILEVLEISRHTMQQIKFNNAWAVAYNLIAVSVACGLFERYGLRLDAAMAGSIMAFSSISVIVFSLLLRRRLASINFKK